MAEFGLSTIRRMCRDLNSYGWPLRPGKLGYVLGGGWPILGYRPSAACLEVLNSYSNGWQLRPAEFMICTWWRMADFALSAIRRMCRDFI